ncbi:3'-5' exoribonuclease [Massilia sp. RP-1-19]|uniref:3'-5' exoribonuclease n=1 Tax=Massilia polaris TaxID=2728846 RepID=A0A848HSJ4_9BURK|nr:3'-5' exonuclease [Massilia polaris]NML62243.1 3'-5' exoribonuclease [Massilia polaris]
MNDVMVDLETMGTGPNAAIIAIGAVEFDLAKGEVGDRFYAVVSLESSVTNGGVIDPSTVIWWLGQSDEARKAVCADAEHINVALLRFTTWLSQCAARDDLRVWGNGAGFDNVVLEEAYRRSQLTRPWHFWNNRCYRTMKGLQPDLKAVRTGTHHNALDDAMTQAKHLIAVMQHRPTAAHAGGLQSCTCPSGDGSLGWPCPVHPAHESPERNVTE